MDGMVLDQIALRIYCALAAFDKSPSPIIAEKAYKMAEAFLAERERRNGK